MTVPADLSSLIIHLDRAVDRQGQIDRLSSAFGPSAQVVRAVDGRELHDYELAAVQARCPATRYPFRLSRAEVATFLSHRACWKKIVDEGREAALVLEDDVDLTPDFPRALALACSHLEAGSLVRFPCKAREVPGVILASDGPVRLFRPRSVGLGMVAQIVTHGAAERLLATSEQFDRPVDVFLQLSWVHRVDVLCVAPSGIREISSEIGGSSIQHSLPPLARLRHELLRPIYRGVIAFQARRFRGDS